MAQSAAAMVAVIGGFLVSRVITPSAERRGLDRPVREIRETAQEKEGVLREVRQNRQAKSWSRFLNLVPKAYYPNELRDATVGGRTGPSLLTGVIPGRPVRT